MLLNKVQINRECEGYFSPDGRIKTDEKLSLKLSRSPQMKTTILRYYYFLFHFKKQYTYRTIHSFCFKQKTYKTGAHTSKKKNCFSNWLKYWYKIILQRKN